MARCGCGDSLVCSCSIEGDITESIETVVDGFGTAEQPYTVTSDLIVNPATDDVLNVGASGLQLVRSPDAGNQLQFAANGLLVPAVAIGTDDDLAVWAKTGVLFAPSSGTMRYKFPFAATIINVTASVNTAPTGAAIIVDVNKNGTTIFTTQANRPTIAIGAFQEATDAIPDVTAIANDDYLTIDIDQVGSTIAGADLTVFVRYRR